MAKLFASEVPKSTTASSRSSRSARDPAIARQDRRHLQDSSIDPVGACVGMRGSRVQAVVQELQGEKIDIIPWSVTRPPHRQRAAAGEVATGVLDEEPNAWRWWCPTTSCRWPYGRRGQNVRLASQLTGLAIDILTEQEESERRQKEFNERTELS